MIDVMDPMAFTRCRWNTQNVLEQLIQKYPELLLAQNERPIFVLKCNKYKYIQVESDKPIKDEIDDFTSLDKFADRFENGQSGPSRIDKTKA